MAHAIGEEIGHSDDEAQAELLNGFLETLHRSMPLRPDQVDTQICFVVGKLSPLSKKVLLRFADFIEGEDARA
jgi:hypothetical protein